MTTEAVTIDAHGTLVSLRDPVPALQRALAERGAVCYEHAVRHAFEEEVAFYVPRSHTARDRDSLAALRAECARVFTNAAGADLILERVRGVCGRISKSGHWAPCAS